MKVGIVCHPTYGGSGVVAAELGKALAKKGHTVHLFSYSLPVRVPHFHENVFFHRVEVSSYPLFRYPSYSLELSAVIVEVARGHGLDLVHAHYAIPHGMSAWTAREILAHDGVRLPFVTTLHGTDITIVGGQPNFAPVTKHILEQSDALTAVSAFLSEATREFFGVLRPVKVIPNFIDPSEFRHHRTSLRACLSPGGEKVAIHVSNFRPVKNIPDIIRAFGLVGRSVPARLALVGDGPERPRAEQLCRELGLGDRVIFVGMQSNVVDYLSAADVYVMASETESFGLSILEAMACGLPVAAYRVGGVPEVAADGETAVLVEKGDVVGLSEALNAFFTDEGKARAFGAAGHRRAVSKFTTRKAVAAYEAVYKSVLE